MGTRETLAKHPLFCELTPDGVDRLVDVGRIEYWPEGAVLLEEGSVGPRMMLVLEGTVEVRRKDSNGVNRTLARLASGEILGEMSLLLDMPRTASVVATDDLRVFSMDRAAFSRMVDEGDPAALRFGMELARMLASRLITLNATVVDLLVAVEDSEPLQQRFGEARQQIFRLWDY